MDNEKIFELMTKMYSDLKNEIGGLKNDIGSLKSDVGSLKSDVRNLKTDVGSLKTEVSEVKKTVIKIEDEHGKKLEALFDGYKQNSEQLQRIQDEVSKHEEVIIRRVK